ncbi:MAG: hypothetical protein K0Q99_755 [Clostridia bacterium]|jgi:hypothetical protein|nr:hypothetical protein [Clostridia bacterium]
MYLEIDDLYNLGFPIGLSLTFFEFMLACKLLIVNQVNFYEYEIVCKI